MLTCWLTGEDMRKVTDQAPLLELEVSRVQAGNESVTMCKFLETVGGRVRDYSLLAALGEAFTFAIPAVSGHVHIVLQLFAFSVVALWLFQCACALQLRLGAADPLFYFACNHGTPESLKLMPRDCYPRERQRRDAAVPRHFASVRLRRQDALPRPGFALLFGLRLLRASHPWPVFHF